MQPIGQLMQEHRLIERMMALLREELERMESRGAVDTSFIATFVDFIRTYTDRIHHGKEEEIYFRDLLAKGISPEHEELVRELMQEHAYTRRMVKLLGDSNARYTGGDEGALEEILKAASELLRFYPGHMNKEEKRFFFPTQEYFTGDELAVMLTEFRDLDSERIHDRYSEIVENLGDR